MFLFPFNKVYQNNWKFLAKFIYENIVNEFNEYTFCNA